MLLEIIVFVLGMVAETYIGVGQKIRTFLKEKL